RRLLDPIHVLDGAVAALASDARDDVLAVVEVDEVGQVVDLGPDDGPSLLHGLLHALDLGGLFLHQRVAVHADAGRRDPGVAAGARPRVAIETGDLVVAGMDLVREGDRLLGRVALMDADARGAAGEQPATHAQHREHENDRAYPHQTALLPCLMTTAPL